MTSQTKAFLLNLLVAAGFAILAFLVIRIIYGSELSIDAQRAFSMYLVIPGFLILLCCVIYSKAYDQWICELSGHQRPPPKPRTPEQEKFMRGATVALVTGALVVVWVWKVAPELTQVNAMISAVVGVCALSLFLIGVAFEEFSNRYGGATIGLLVSFFLLSQPVDFDFSLVPLFLVVAIPTILGHLIHKWWNKQDFVIAARRRQQLASEQSALQQRNMEEETRARAYIATVMPVAPGKPGEMTDEAKTIAAGLDAILKQ